LATLDWIVIGAYGLAVLALGRSASRGHGSADDLLVGGRSVPTWAVLCSMVATELSAATFLGVPDAAFAGAWSYLQLAFGALLGKVFVSIRVVPLYHRLGVVSIYQLLEQRFGAGAQRAAAGCFIAGRLLASGVRLFIAALAFSVVTETSVSLAIVACGLIAGLYTRAGGIRSVIWTDVLQAGVFLSGAFALLFAAAAAVPGGLDAIWAWAEPAGRTDVFMLTPLLTWSDSSGFGTAVLGGFFLTLATHGTDFDMVQRLLAARSGRAGGAALTGSALLNFPITALFLLVGTAIAAVHALAPPTWEADAARVVPTFALHALPIGFRGLVFAGLLAAAMSSLDSAICAIATTWTVDFAASPGKSDLAMRTRRAAVLASGALVISALAMAGYHSLLRSAGGGPTLGLVEFALSAMTILYGGLLGVFAIAIGTRSAGSERGAILGLCGGSAVGLLLFLHPVVLGEMWLAWTWWIPLSATVAALVTWLWPQPISRNRGPENAPGPISRGSKLG
jgi:SSS family solute:Na+ symporter